MICRAPDLNTSPVYSYLAQIGCLLLLPLLISCGFQLRTSAHAITPTNFWISGTDAAQPLALVLIQSMRTRGIIPVNRPEEAQYTLTLSGFDIKRKAVTFTATVHPAEYALRSSVHFKLLSTEGELVQEGTVRADRTYKRIASNLVAGSQEETRIRAELGHDLAQQITALIIARMLTTGPGVVDRTSTEETKRESGSHAGPAP